MIATQPNPRTILMTRRLYKPETHTAVAEARRQLEWLMGVASLPQAEIARRLNTYPATISRWVKRHTQPSPLACTAIHALYTEEVAKHDVAQTS